MPLYLLTNPHTFSRAVVSARNSNDAQELRPDGAFWRHGAWHTMQETKTPGMGWSGRATAIVLAGPCREWPVEPSDVCADLLANHPETNFDHRSNPVVICFEATDRPRGCGDGPDSWWTPDEHAQYKGGEVTARTLAAIASGGVRAP